MKPLVIYEPQVAKFIVKECDRCLSHISEWSAYYIRRQYNENGKEIETETLCLTCSTSLRFIVGA